MIDICHWSPGMAIFHWSRHWTEHGNAGKVKENMDGTGVQCLTPVQGVVPAQGSVHCLTLVLHWPRALDYFIWRLLLPPITKIKALQRANYFAGAPSIPLSQKRAMMWFCCEETKMLIDEDYCHDRTACVCAVVLCTRCQAYRETIHCKGCNQQLHY